MNGKYPAKFLSAEGRAEEITVFVSTVTLTIRKTNEEGQHIDLNWLVDEMVAYQTPRQEWEFQLLNALGTGGRLIVADDELTQELFRKVPRLFKKSGGRKQSNPAVKWLLALGCLFIAFVIAFYVWTLPWIGEKLAEKFPKQTEIEMGRKMLSSSISLQEIDSAKTKAINQFYKSLDFNVSYPIQITVVKSEQLNAYAIPGGQIVVYDAILEDMKTPEQLAALLAHETTHIAQRHTLKSLFRQSSRQLFWSFLFGSDAGMAGYLVNQAETLKNLGFSRALESESDEMGMLMMARAGVNPEGMLQLMELLSKGSRGPEPIAFLSTHPLLEEREKYIKTQLPNWSQKFEVRTDLQSLFHAIYE